MATTEEKQELVETIKGPRFYRIMLWGYGGEAAYIPLNEAQYEFWNNHNEEYGDSDLVTYMTGAEDDDCEFEDIETLPEEAHFMKDEDGDGRPWYEHHDELEHQNGVDYSNARLTIEEVEDGPSIMMQAKVERPQRGGRDDRDDSDRVDGAGRSGIADDSGNTTDEKGEDE